MFFSKNNDLDYNFMDKNVNIAIELYESLQGKYFIGHVDNLKFGNGTNAWVRLYNPPYSGVNLYVNVWTITDITESPFQAQYWFNSDPPGTHSECCSLITPTNTTIQPAPKTKIKIQFASHVNEKPIGGIKAFIRKGKPGKTLVETENGKLIFPPGGSFLIYLSAENPDTQTSSSVGFGWWEDKIKYHCDY